MSATTPPLVQKTRSPNDPNIVEIDIVDTGTGARIRSLEGAGDYVYYFTPDSRVIYVRCCGDGRPVFLTQTGESLGDPPSPFINSSGGRQGADLGWDGYQRRRFIVETDELIDLSRSRLSRSLTP